MDLESYRSRMILVQVFKVLSMNVQQTVEIIHTSNIPGVANCTGIDNEQEKCYFKLNSG